MTDFEKFKLAEFKHWELYLHENQYYLGRSYLWAKRDGDFDFLQMTSEEHDDFFFAAGKVKDALQKAFLPDRLNYLWLSNTSNHLHCHFIPRYLAKRSILGKAFVDTNPTGNYAPYDRSFTVDDVVFAEIKKRLLNHL